MVAFSTHKFGATEFGTTEIGTKEIGTLVNRTSHCAFPVPLAQNNKSKSGTTGSCRTEFGTMLSLVLPDSVTLHRIRYETSTAQQISRSYSYQLQKRPIIRSKFVTTEIGRTEFGTTEFGI